MLPGASLCRQTRPRKADRERERESDEGVFRPRQGSTDASEMLGLTKEGEHSLRHRYTGGEMRGEVRVRGVMRAGSSVCWGTKGEGVLVRRHEGQGAAGVVLTGIQES